MKLSPRQAEILAFIRDSIDQDGLPPTRSEINAHFGFKSPNAAQSHLKALAAKGAIRLDARTARGIVPTVDDEPAPPNPGSLVELPLIGRVAAGAPLLALAHQERRVPVDVSLFRPAPHYLLRVHGDSMKEIGILDGDLLAVHRTQTARDGQIVVARIDDEVTVKRFQRDGERIRLKAENADYDDIVVADEGQREFVIEGLAVGVVRRL
ncbi:transcriptional repressor LexA [Halomonas denitrificans]|nr:transcriptional repressor LexA [Halomonas denitrificans]